MLNRRTFLSLLGAAGLPGTGSVSLFAERPPAGSYAPARIENDCSLFLQGERDALAAPPSVTDFATGRVEIGQRGKTAALAPGEGNRGLAAARHGGDQRRAYGCV